VQTTIKNKTAPEISGAVLACWPSGRQAVRPSAYSAPWTFSSPRWQSAREITTTYKWSWSGQTGSPIWCIRSIPVGIGTGTGDCQLRSHWWH